MIKTKNLRRPSFMSLFLAVALVAGAQGVRAQEDYLLEDSDDVLGGDALQMDSISIEGKLSPSELLRKRREKLEERNKLMVEKKIEDIRVKQEVELTKKLQGAFNKSLNNLNEDKVQVVQAAPVAVAPVAPAPVAPAPVIETRIVEVPAPAPVVPRKTSKVIPSIGVSTIRNNNIDLQSNVNIGIALETEILPQVALGFGIGYTTFEMTDEANNFSTGNNGSIYNPGYYNVFGGSRRMTNDKLVIEAGGKFFFTEDSRLKPFVGAALSYNRSTLKYENNNTYMNNGQNFGNEGFSSGVMAGTIRLGAEVDLNETIGFNLDLTYTKNITSGISRDSNVNSSFNPDQAKLENVAAQIEDGDTTAVAGGVVIKF